MSVSNPSNSDLSNSDPSTSNPSNSDIPAARRQSSVPTAREEQRGRWAQLLGKAVGTLGLSAIAAILIWQWEPISQRAMRQTQRIQTALAQRPSSPSLASASSSAKSALPPLPASHSESLLPSQSTTPVATDGPNQLLNHRRYEEANPADLVPLNPSSQLQLQAPAQAAVNQMIAQAKSEGVQLGIASAFRTIEDQNKLFFDVKAARGESSTTRAEVSAPPGYSEHHTGYAVDFIDESKPSTHTEASFETTPAFQWLKKNAPAYNFELSFPKDANSTVRYEPWHWRYVGDLKSLELFYQEQTPASTSASEAKTAP